MKKRIRILIARLGMDAHWRGSIVVARALRDAGMEVIYIGNQMPQNIVETAIQEDADIIGQHTLWKPHDTSPRRSYRPQGKGSGGEGGASRGHHTP